MSFLIAGARHDTEFWKDIAKRNPRTLSELYSLAKTHKRLEGNMTRARRPSNMGKDKVMTGDRGLKRDNRGRTSRSLKEKEGVTAVSSPKGPKVHKNHTPASITLMTSLLLLANTSIRLWKHWFNSTHLPRLKVRVEISKTNTASFTTTVVPHERLFCIQRRHQTTNPGRIPERVCQRGLSPHKNLQSAPPHPYKGVCQPNLWGEAPMRVHLKLSEGVHFRSRR